MKIMRISFLTLIVLVGLVTAYSFAADSNQYAELTKVPAKESARSNPMEHDPDSIAAGGKLYGLHCAECHGANGEGGSKGKKKGPALKASEIQQAPPGSLFWLLTNGSVRRGMPVWSKLPEPQRWQIVTYLKSLNASGTPQEPANHNVINKNERRMNGRLGIASSLASTFPPPAPPKRPCDLLPPFCIEREW